MHGLCCHDAGENQHLLHIRKIDQECTLGEVNFGTVVCNLLLLLPKGEASYKLQYSSSMNPCSGFTYHSKPQHRYVLLLPTFKLCLWLLQCYGIASQRKLEDTYLFCSFVELVQQNSLEGLLIHEDNGYLERQGTLLDLILYFLYFFQGCIHTLLCITLSLYITLSLCNWIALSTQAKPVIIALHSATTVQCPTMCGCSLRYFCSVVFSVMFGYADFIVNTYLGPQLPGGTVGF